MGGIINYHFDISRREIKRTLNKNHMGTSILLVLEIQRFKSVKACRPKARQAKVNANSSTNSLKTYFL
ncbi:MAG: hypothetical protein LBP59_04430 [Planctomycetaceae bacterium]|jgi:hypothetical protein|nr:hypothetical protein [Planctomycetaceae bacterium]